MASLPGSVGLLRALVAASCLLGITGACGGRSDTQDYLFESDGTISLGASSSSAGRGSTGGGTRSGGGSKATGGSGTVVAGSGPIGGASSISGSGPIGGGAIGFGGTGTGGSGFGGVGTAGVGVAGNGAAGTGGKPSVVPISCGSTTCDGNTQVCCAGLGGLGCVAKNADCNGAVLSCTTPSDCSGGQICCVAVTGDVANASSCKDRCDNLGSGRDRQICNVDADCQAPLRFCTATIFGINICTRRP